MNKTIIINISGAIFHIEEDAYEVLKSYMTEVKRHFGLSADSFEIVTDIENRIAELFSEILKRDMKQVITLPDVEAIITQMGRPVDFDLPDNAEPAATEETESIKNPNRKLYRDGDDKVLGGVCSGLAHYFSTDPVWLRLIWALLFIAAGFGTIPYIILWIVMPVARTRAEKLAMYGEEVNLETIRNSVNEEINVVRKNISKYRNQVKDSGIEDRLGSFFKEVFQFIGRLVQGIIKIAGVFTGILAIFMGSIFILALFISATTLLFNGGLNVWHHHPFSIIAIENRNGTLISVVIAILIPLIFLVLLGIRILFKRLTINVPVGSALLITWFIALCFTGYYAALAGREFSEQASINQEIPIRKSSNHTYFLKADASGVDMDSLYKGSVHQPGTNWHIHINGEQERGSVNIDISRSDSTGAVLLERIAAKGMNSRDALKHADEIVYRFTQNDSILSFPTIPFYLPEHGFHEQQVDLTLKIPVNTVITVDPELNINNLPDKDLYTYNGNENVWIMTTGGLKPRFGELKRSTENDNSEDQQNDKNKDRSEDMDK